VLTVRRSQDPLLLEEQELAGENATYNAALLCIMMALLYADQVPHALHRCSLTNSFTDIITDTSRGALQNLMAPNLTAIANDFGFTAAERDQKLGGEIALGFFVLGAFPLTDNDLYRVTSTRFCKLHRDATRLEGSGCIVWT